MDKKYDNNVLLSWTIKIKKKVLSSGLCPYNTKITTLKIVKNSLNTYSVRVTSISFDKSIMKYCSQLTNV